jgi:uncharacterized protein
MSTQTSALPAKVLIIPGLYGSGPEHWQSQWERQHPEFIRVEQKDWNTPVCDDWIAMMDAAIRQAGDDVILVGHSLGSVAIAHWACRFGRKIAGAVLVAPSDTEALTFPAGVTGFAPIPTGRFPFSSTVIASTEDPYMDLERVTRLAEAWGSDFVALGSHGHISTADGFGPWPEGLQYIAAMQAAWADIF